MESRNKNNILNEMAFGITKDILLIADNPKEALPRLADELREITGAKIVALLKCQEGFNNKNIEHSLVSIIPKRKNNYAESEIFRDLTKLANNSKKTILLSDESDKKEYKKLSAQGFELSLIVPLILNDVLYGTYILLGLPTKVNLDIIIKGLEQLTEAITLLFRYSLIYTKMDELVDERTQSLKENQENLRTTLNSIGDAVISTDLKGKIVHLNPIAEKLTGWSKKETTGKSLENVFNIINENTRIKVDNPIERTLREGVITALPNRTLLISKDGKEIPIADSGSPIINDDGEITGVVLVFRDQTKERRIKKVLQESEERFRNVFENSVIGKTMTNIDGKMKTNEAYCKMLGYTEDELSKMKWHEITHPEDVENDQKIIQSILNGMKESARWEKRYLHKNGNIVWIDISTTLQRDNEGQPLYFISSINDITERKQAEEELIKHREHLEQLVKVRTKELEDKNKELDKAMKVFIGRELKIRDLQKRIKELEG